MGELQVLKLAIYDAGSGLGVRLYRPRLRSQGEEQLTALAFLHDGGFYTGRRAD